MRAHAAAVSSAGPGATAKTIRMHNKRTSGAASPTAGRSLAAVSLYKVKEEGTQRGGSSSTMCETDDSRSPPTAESRTANLFTKAGRECARTACLSDGESEYNGGRLGARVWCLRRLCFTTEAISRTGMIDDYVTARRARLRIVGVSPLAARRTPTARSACRSRPRVLRLARSGPGRPAPGPDRIHGSFCGAPRRRGRGPLGWAPSTLEPIGIFPLSKTLLSGTAARHVQSRPRLKTETLYRYGRPLRAHTGTPVAS